MNTPSRSVRAVVMSTAMVTTGIVSSVAAAPAAQASYTTCRPSPDTVPAVVDSVSFDKPTVDLSNGPSPITVSVHATDYGNAAPTGVRLMRIQLVGPMNEVHTKLALTSGTAIDGTWSHTFKLPAATVSGQFHVRLLEVMDHQQNTDYYIREGKYPTSPFDPRLQADWSDFTVVGGAPARTLPRGKVTSFSFNRRSVDTRRAPMPIRASASFSGTQPTAVLLYLVGRSHMGRPYLEHLHLHRSAHHIWSRRIVIPQWTGDATVRAELHLVYADNVKPHERNLRFRTNALRRHQAFDVRSQIDDTKPALTGLSIPSSVDVTSGAQKIPVSATTSDAQSGVAGMVLRFYPAGHHSVGYSYAKLEQDGNSWSGTARIPPCVTSGEWHVGVYLADHQGNHIDYTPARLKAASLPDQLAVTSTPPGDIVQLGVSGSSASGVDHTITLNFSSAVKTVNEKTLTVYDRTKQPGAFTSPLTISAISCSDGTSIVACDGSDGLATSATLTVPQLVVGRPYGIYANQDSVTPQLSDAADNPLGWDGAVTSVRPS